MPRKRTRTDEELCEAQTARKRRQREDEPTREKERERKRERRREQPSRGQQLNAVREAARDRLPLPVATLAQERWWLAIATASKAPPTLFWRANNCPHCGAKLLNKEDSAFCCSNGRRVLAKLPPLPPHLAAFVDPENGVSKSTSDFSRIVNNLFCFTAIGFTGGSREFDEHEGLYSISVHGKVYHRMLPADTVHHSIHWYLYDPGSRDLEARGRSVPEALSDGIAEDLEHCNPFVHALRRFAEFGAQEPEAVLELKDPGDSDEIAAVFHANNTATAEPRSILIWRQSDAQPAFISIFSAMYEPLQYPLLFPHGSFGWSPDNAMGMTQNQWYRCRLLQEPRFRQLGRVACEWLIDMFSRMEEERLLHIRQAQVRAAQDSTDVNVNLPSSFTGSARWAAEETANSLALARALGKPSLFVTMTCNPNWPEIVSELGPDENATAVPDLVARVFNARLKHLLHLLRTRFGNLLYLVRVIEWQKRGLPHCHIICKVHPELPFDQIDSVISAEMPINNPSLATKIEKHMTHSDQHLKIRNEGQLNERKSRCNKDGKCVWGFPHRLQPHTTIDEFGRVQFRRRKPGDDMVISHIPFLLDSLDCHIHADITSTVHVFLYVYKYLFKGSDRAGFSLKLKHDETQDYVNSRYVTAPEAGWRILNFHVTQKEPAVDPLHLHLPDASRANLYRSEYAQSGTSPLDRYWLRPKDTARIRNMRYVEYYERCDLSTYRGHENLANDEWLEQPQDGVLQQKVRLRTKMKVCRLQAIPPSAGELFYIRCLLAHRPASSFTDLRTVNNVCHTTFQAAAKALGIIHDSNEGLLAMQEAVEAGVLPRARRFLFAQLILEGSPAQDLWDRFNDDLALDYLDVSPTRQKAYDKALIDIASVLADQGSTLEKYGLPQPQKRSIEVDLELEAFEGQEEDLLREATGMCTTMNPEQRRIYDYFTDLLLAQEQDEAIPSLHFIEGKAGRGKTFLIRALASWIRSRQRIVLICASSALAATNYERGRTAHNLFGIPVQENNVGLKSYISAFSNRADLIREAEAIIWEELPMSNKAAVECANELCKLVMKNDKPFGGKLFLALGDFRQVAPVVRGGGESAARLASILTSTLWPKFNLHRLHSPMRNALDPEYANFIDAIGEDPADTVSLDLLQRTNSMEEVMQFLYSDDDLQVPESCANKAFLTPLNSTVNDFNARVLERLQEEQVSYCSSNEVRERDEIVDDHPVATTDYLALLEHTGVPPHELHLKLNCLCTLMRNFSVRKGLVKNARVVVRALHARFVEVSLVRGERIEEEKHPLPRIAFAFKPDYATWTVIRRQIPLRLAYACTFNSCQGLTLDLVAVDVRIPVFAHGQLYTALSRIRRRENALVLFPEDSNENCCRNVVHRTLLLPRRD